MMTPEQYEAHVERAARYTGGVLRSPYGLWGLALISFVESVLVIPLITDPFLVVYILANRSAAVRGVVVTTLASVAGGVVAYVMAAAFYEFIVAYYLTGNVGVQFFEIAHGFQDNTFVLTLIGALTPIPYTIVALVVGFVKGSLIAFIIASVIGRGARYALVGWLTHRFGEDALAFARRRVALLTSLCIFMIIVYLVSRSFIG